MINPTQSFSVNVDVTNPGQFFACCGLLELAHRLWPGAEGWFDTAGGAFSLCVGDTDARLDGLIEKIAGCGLEGLTQDQRTELEELERRKRELRKRGQRLSEAEERRRTELGKQAREGRLIVRDFRLTLDWWQEEGAPATWAGKQEIHKIARAAQDAVGGCLQDEMPVENLLNWPRVLRMPAEYGSNRAADKKVEPYYFDARRYAHPLDEGFSLDVQGVETDACPATEFLCLIGLQRFRPQADPVSRWRFDYRNL
jgi:CRISPR-associated protein Csx14